MTCHIFLTSCNSRQKGHWNFYIKFIICSLHILNNLISSDRHTFLRGEFNDHVRPRCLIVEIRCQDFCPQLFIFIEVQLLDDFLALRKVISLRAMRSSFRPHFRTAISVVSSHQRATCASDACLCACSIND